ncbi:MAG: ParB/RepB/Spo0J family partition protein [Clostridia bacterium]|nr:ParB/RepB/Spo0J family partition protein [Clostridia bacterium]MDY5263974.1 ParB/RepB/Spo0J family partition protein [Eubacteriales bacterium]
MSEKNPLGKGLNALFSDILDDDFIETKTIIKKHLDDVDINLIDTNPNQPRKYFDEDALKDLAESIKHYGIIQPLILLQTGERYLIIAGERRFRAAKLAGLTVVPAVIKELTNQEVQEIALIENLQREDLNPIEAAEAIQELMVSHNLTQEQVASKIGKSRPGITNTLRLLTLEKPVIDMVREGRLSAGHARALVVVDDKAFQVKLAEQAADNKMSVRQLETQVKLFFNRKLIPQGPRKKEAQSKEVKELINDMKRIFGTKVKALGNNQKGRIYIDYYNEDDLQRIYDIIEKLRKDINREV